MRKGFVVDGHKKRDPTLKERILNMVLDRPDKRWKIEDIITNARFSGRNKNTIRGVFSFLAKQGLFIRVNKGVYDVDPTRTSEWHDWLVKRKQCYYNE